MSFLDKLGYILVCNVLLFRFSQVNHVNDQGSIMRKKHVVLTISFVYK